MKVLIACEFSGIMRDAFRAEGHDAWSCDLIETEIKGNHIIDDAITVSRWGSWDLMVAHPPCTHLSRSGAHAWKRKVVVQGLALDFVRALLDAPIPKIALENPIGKINSAIRQPDQIVQPHQFGHGEVKATCWWLVNLPLLVPTRKVKGRKPKTHYEPPGPNRWRNRSRTLKGCARACARQWGS